MRCAHCDCVLTLTLFYPRPAWSGSGYAFASFRFPLYAHFLHAHVSTPSLKIWSQAFLLWKLVYLKALLSFQEAQLFPLIDHRACLVENFSACCASLSSPHEQVLSLLEGSWGVLPLFATLCVLMRSFCAISLPSFLPSPSLIWLHSCCWSPIQVSLFYLYLVLLFARLAFASSQPQTLSSISLPEALHLPPIVQQQRLLQSKVPWIQPLFLHWSFSSLGSAS